MANRWEVPAHPVKITVMKKTYNEDMVKDYAADPDVWAPCGHFNIGDEFITDAGRPWDMPKGFCGWAWADIQKLVHGMARGGQRMFVTCCTDGYRPVIFKLERMDPPAKDDA